IQKDLIDKVMHVAEVRIENLKARVREGDPPVAAAPKPVVDGCAAGIDLVAIGSSTGGPPALQQLFQTLPLLPIPFVVAQHMPATFTRLFAERVNRLTQYEVKEAKDGETLDPGVVYIAPGGCQTEIEWDGSL